MRFNSPFLISLVSSNLPRYTYQNKKKKLNKISSEQVDPNFDYDSTLFEVKQSHLLAPSLGQPSIKYFCNLLVNQDVY